VTSRGLDAPAGLAIGIGFVLLGGLIAFDTSRMQIMPTYAKVGPQVFPYLTSIALAGTGLFFALQSLRRWPHAVVAEERSADLQALLAISVGLIVQMVLIGRLGFVLSSTFLFVAVAWGFGSRRMFRDTAIGLALTIVTYVVFTRFLALQLPAGLLKGVF
jgi:putative tricarboxylic transport membrane protein